ncbi:MAG: hypothetical protein AAF657_17015 [Acidobacteriota bacterium]
MLDVALPAAFARQIRTARELVEDRRRAPEEIRVPTASAGFDRLLEGGLQRGAMIELIGSRSSGRFSLVLTTLAAATEAGEAAALVDLGDALDPQAAAAAGVDLERLLWVRPRRIKEVLASAEAVLDSGMPLVVIDLGMPPLPGGRGVEAAWLRLARSARARDIALLISSPYRVSGTAAQAVLEARRPRATWLGRGSSPRLLHGVDTQLELVKSRRGERRGKIEALTWRLAESLYDDRSGTAHELDETQHETVPFREAAPFRAPLRERAIA